MRWALSAGLSWQWRQDAFEAAGQNGLQESTRKFRRVDGDDSLAALVVSAHAQPHPGCVPAEDALVGHCLAVGVARQAVQHRLGPGQRRLGTDHPVVALERVEPELPRRWRVAGVARQFMAALRGISVL